MARVRRIPPRRGKISRVKVLWPVIAIDIVYYLTLVVCLKSWILGSISVIFIVIASLLALVLNLSHTAYVLKIARTGDAGFLDITQCAKEKGWKFLGLSASVLFCIWILSFIVSFLDKDLMTFAYIFLIIIFLDYTMAIYLIADADMGVLESLKKSRSLMKGHKMDYIKFVASAYTTSGYVNMYAIAMFITFCVALVIRFVFPSFWGFIIVGAISSIFDIVLGLMLLYITPMIMIGSAMFYDKLIEIDRESNEVEKIQFRVINKKKENKNNLVVEEKDDLDKSLVIDPFKLVTESEKQKSHNETTKTVNHNVEEDGIKSENIQMSSKFEKLVNFDPTGGFDENMMNDGINTSTTYGNIGTIGNFKEQIKKHELENQVNEKAELPNEDEKNISNLDKTENKNSNTKSNDGKLHILGE